MLAQGARAVRLFFGASKCFLTSDVCQSNGQGYLVGDTPGALRTTPGRHNTYLIGL